MGQRSPRTQAERVSFWGAKLAILALVILCGACAGREPRLTRQTPSPSPPPSPTPSATPPPKMLTVCTRHEPDSLYPYANGGGSALHVLHALYDGPMDRQHYRRQPVILTEIPSLEHGAAVETATVQTGDRVLATTGSVMTLTPGVIVEDASGRRTTFRGEPIEMRRMVVTFTLRSDVRWSDGEPLTADDSVYGFELAADPDTPADKLIIERTSDYRAVGEHLIVWEGVPGFLDRAYYTNFWHPVPRHAWEGFSAGELLTAEVSTRRPLGWGPFAMRVWVDGDSIVMERNPFYFRAPDGLPRVDEVTFRFIEDAQELARHLSAGTCDVVTHEAVADLDVDRAAAQPGVEAYTTQESAWELLAFNISPLTETGQPDFFEDVRARRGIAQCIDRQAVTEEVVGGGRMLHSYVPPDHPTYAGEEVTAWPYDPEAGKRLLAEAGWYDEDGDGIREAHGISEIPEGTPFEVTYKTTDDPLRLRTAGMIEDQLAACGIRVSVQVEPADTLFAPGPEGTLFGRQFELAQFSWEVTTEPLCDSFLSSQTPSRGDWNKPNVAGFIDARYDAACQDALKALPGSADYLSRQGPPQRIFSEQMPVVPLFQRRQTTLSRSNVSGLSPNPSEPSELWNLEEIDLSW